MREIEHTVRGDFTPDAESLMRIMRILRAPGGCPWDRAQTRHTLTGSLAGECAEAIDAIDRDAPADICEELGDLLMNVFLQVAIAEENKEFTLEDVWRTIIAKMIRRHAHIFGDARAETPEEVAKLWVKIKESEHKDEGKPRSLMDKVPHYLSALTRAEKLQKQAAKVGFDWPDAAGAAEKVREEASELTEALASGDDFSADDELGDLLFAAVNLARKRQRGSAEDLLRAAARKFETRFRAVEAEVAASGKPWEEHSPAELDELWERAKRASARK